MSFNALSSAEVETGKPVKTTTQTKIKDNFDDHEERLLSLEAEALGVPAPIIFKVSGSVGVSHVREDIQKTVINFNMQVTGVRIYVNKAGSSGTYQIDLKYSRSGGSYTSILSTKPSVAFGAGNDAISSNAVINTSEDNLQAGDILRLDVDTFQVNGRDFFVRVDYVRE